MPTYRPSLDYANNRTPVELRMSGTRRGAVEFGEPIANHWSRQRDGAPPDVDSADQAFGRHAALLDDSRESRPASRIPSGIRRAIIVRRLQRDHGTRYFQRLIEHVARRVAIKVQQKIAARPSWDGYK